MRAVLGTLLVAFCVACAGPSSDVARAKEIEAQVWSPYCPGRVLSECSTEQAQDLRQRIAQRVEDGESSDEVLRWVRQEYGDGAIARPETSGLGLVVWLVPVAIFLLGAVLVVRYVSRNVEDRNQHPNEEEIHADP